MSHLRGETQSADAPFPDQDLSDVQLVAQAKLGDSGAFALLYRRYVDRIYDYSRRRLSNREDAEDATQATFIRAMRSIEGCRDGELFAGWLFAIARNVVRDHAGNRRTKLISLDDVAEAEDRSRSPVELAESADWAARLTRASMECLGRDDRELLELRLQGLNDREISVATARSYGAIRVAQHRMLQRLRRCLGIGTEAEHALR